MTGETNVFLHATRATRSWCNMLARCESCRVLAPSQIYFDSPFFMLLSIKHASTPH